MPKKIKTEVPPFQMPNQEAWDLNQTTRFIRRNSNLLAIIQQEVCIRETILMVEIPFSLSRSNAAADLQAEKLPAARGKISKLELLACGLKVCTAT